MLRASANAGGVQTQNEGRVFVGQVAKQLVPPPILRVAKVRRGKYFLFLAFLQATAHTRLRAVYNVGLVSILTNLDKSTALE